MSAALGAAATTGIPLTHREASSSVAFVTAHRRHDATSSDLAARVPREGTVVLYMGLSTLRATALALVAAGRTAATPIAVISHATMPTEREVIGDLATIADLVEAAQLEAPVLMIVGEVVRERTRPSPLASPLAPRAESGLAQVPRQEPFGEERSLNA